MDSAELVQLLWETTLVATLASLLLLCVPTLLRRRFGAGAAYAAWLLFPAMLLASLVPAMPARTLAVAPVAAEWMPPVASTAVGTAIASAVRAPVSMPADAWPWHALALALWACGAAAACLGLWRRQRRFVRALGPLSRDGDGLWRAAGRVGLPALVGVAPARIVLPVDFDTRYDARERQLMLAHERTHRRRGDHLANFAVAALRCVFWFNPLVHLAARSFRHDQELACDQAVIAAHPDSRRAYGEAMLKTLMADRQAPLGCHWGLSHPMKDRLMQLKNEIPQAGARRIGAAAAGALALAAAFAVWSAQPAAEGAAPGVAALSTRASSASNAAGAQGVFITTRLLGAGSDRRVLRETTYWMAPGLQAPASMYPSPDHMIVRAAYAVERRRDGTMIAELSLPDPAAGDRPAKNGSKRISLLARADRATRYEQAIGPDGSRVQIDVLRGANPCNDRSTIAIKSAGQDAFPCKGGDLAEHLVAQMSGQGALDAPSASAADRSATRVDVRRTTVRLNVLVGRDGRVKDAKVVAAGAWPEVQARALDAIRNERFPPRVEQGRAVDDWRQVSIDVEDYMPRHTPAKAS